jgi:multiple sugar transport system substrate-binding protein
MKSRLLKLALAVALIFVALPSLTRTRAADVTIKFWHTYNETSPENKMLSETLIPSFEKANPGIKVESVPVPYDGYRQSLITAMAGGEGPDVARIDIIWSPELAKLGALAPLSDLLGADFDTYAKAVFPGPLATNFYQGKYYGVPLDTNTRVWLYNADTYKAAGVEVPKTIADLEKSCEAFKKAGFPAFADGGTYGWALLPWIWTLGGSITDKDATKATGHLNSPETIAAVNWLKARIDEGCFGAGFRGSGDDNNANFFANKLGAVLDGPWAIAGAAQQRPDFKISTATVPAGKGGSISVIGGENIVLMSYSKNQEAALKFIRFTLSDEYQLKMSETGQITVLTKLIDSDYYKTHPYYGVYLEQLKTAQPRTVHPSWNKVEEVITNATQKIIRGEGDAKAILDEAAKEVDAMLAEGGTGAPAAPATPAK